MEWKYIWKRIYLHEFREDLAFAWLQFEMNPVDRNGYISLYAFYVEDIAIAFVLWGSSEEEVYCT